MRTKYLDPDFRPRPRTPLFCCVCYKDLTPAQARHCVLTANGGTEAIHRDDFSEGLAAGAVLYPIGPDCAVRLGDEWLAPCRVPGALTPHSTPTPDAGSR